jgi:hypothetical protein
MATKSCYLLSSLSPFFACAARSIQVPHVARLQGFSHSSSLTLRANAQASPKDSYTPMISPSIVATDPLIYGAGVV